MFGVYFHFPYCIKKCNYCGFYSLTEKIIDFSYWQSFYQKKIKDFDFSERKITSIYFGGGTPSLMPVKMVEEVLGNFCLKDVEVTLEANPETIDLAKMKELKSVGVNRISIGVQSFLDKDLEFMGRIHSAKKAREVIENAKIVFDKVSIDLIYGRPEQSLKSWEQELKDALRFDLSHFSMYQLTLDNDWNVSLPEDELLADFYELTTNILEDSGIKRYEVSNYAKDRDNQSCHNLTYWLGGDFLGIGPMAHSRIDCREIANDEKGIVNIDRLLSKKERDTEIFLTSLRTCYGVCNVLLYLTNADKINEMVKNGFLLEENNGIRVTKKGYLILDSISSFLLK